MISFSRSGGNFVLHAEQWLPARCERVFEFFSNAFQLEAITPPWLRFEVLTPPPIELRQGTLIDYRLRMRGVPLRWQSEISLWEPPLRFVDRQTRGPYRLWRHEHRFVERDGGTLAIDEVEYRVLGGRLVNRLLVQRDLRKIFGYRQAKLAEVFSPKSLTA